MTERNNMLTFHYTDGTTKEVAVRSDQREFTIGWPLKKGLVAITGTLPDFVEEFVAVHCDDLQYLPDFNPGLRRLYLSYCKSLKALPELPPGLKKLTVDRCHGIETISQLSEGLEEVDIDWCDGIKSIDCDLPSGLISLRIWNCRKFVTLPKLPYQLAVLKVHGRMVLSAGIQELKKRLNTTAVLDYIWRTGRVDERYQMIMQYGLEQFIADSLGVPQQIHQDEAGTLYRVYYPDARPLIFVEVINAQEDSIEKTWRVVDPLCRPMSIDADGKVKFGDEQAMTARNAVIATFGMVA